MSTAISVLGGVGLFLLGMTVMTEGLKALDRKSTRLNSSHPSISYAVFCLKKKTDRLQSSTTVMFSKTENIWQNEGWQGIEQVLMHRPPNLDVRRAWSDDGTRVRRGSDFPH